ncbi:MAG: PQQ-binding-like beta-propeller repeat protein [Candidatus Bathyarchaeia archaeon]
MNKFLATTLTAILMLSIAAAIIAIPIATADNHPYQVDTYCYVDVNPRPVGVGQEAFVTFGIDKVPMTVSTRYGDRWDNLTLTIGYPDGTSKTLSGFVADDTGFTYTTWTPDHEGNYTFQCHFLGEYLTGENPPPGGFSTSSQAYIGDYYKPSESTIVTITVTSERAESLPTNPLPTDYWQRPINMMNNNWNTISGNWFGMHAYVNAGLGYNMTGNYDPYTEIVNTPHVLWTTPLAPGGLIGGEFGGTLNSNFYAPPQYECKFKEVIVNGVLYYTYMPAAGSLPEGTIAQDLLTGEILWNRNDWKGQLRMGQVYNYISPNQYGGQAYLWSTSGSTWSMYEATTGNWILDIFGGNTNGDFMASEDGSILDYYIDTSNSSQYYLTCWNSSRCILARNGTGDISNWRFQPTQSSTLNWSYGIMWQAPIAMEIDGNPIRLTLSGPQSSGNIGITGNSVIMGYGTTGNWGSWQVVAAYDLTDGHQNFLVNRTYEYPWNRVLVYTSGNGKYCELYTEGKQYIGLYNAETGAEVCKCYLPDGGNMWTYFAAYRPIEAYGLLYQGTFDGHVYAWDATTGALEWTWYAGDAGYDTVYGSHPCKVIELVADGKVFINEGHTYNPPMFRGSHAVAINATTGETVWKVLSFCHSNAPVVGAADGVLLLPNSYDNLIYAFGKGRSATTVDAPLTAVTMGSSVTIRGTVTDQSPGDTCLGIPAAGTPAIADASMEEWMEYLYQQQPKPYNATGVNVDIYVLDANDNYRQIGSTTSNADGFYSFSWQPDIEGKFTVFAVFAGSESYFSSSADTAFTVDPAPATPTPAPVQALPPTEMYFAVSTIAIVIAIAIVGAVILMAVKKH